MACPIAVCSRRVGHNFFGCTGVAHVKIADIGNLKFRAVVFRDDRGVYPVPSTQKQKLPPSAVGGYG